MSGICIGIDLGGTNTKIGIFDADLAIIARDSIPTEARYGPEHVVARIADAARSLLAASNISPDYVKALGVGAPGPADIRQGIIHSSPNMPEFINVPLRDMLADELDMPVVYENDANAACWGEYTLGAGRGVTDMIMLTLGTGIGGGVVAEGKLLHGFRDNAGELGHIIIYPGGRKCGCGQHGCAEAYASANSTAARAIDLVRQGAPSAMEETLHRTGTLTSRDVFEHAAAGDQAAAEIVEGTARTLALLCINLLHTTGPRRIVLAGGMIAAGHALLAPVKAAFDGLLWNARAEGVEICLATLGDDAGIVGAAALAANVT